jgi:hypothetical protein
MADVRLDFYDLDAEALPDVCMKCGAPSNVRPVQTFSWTPLWARMLPPLIAVFFVKRRRVPVPLCERHKHYWAVRRLIGLGGLGLFVLLCAAGIALVAADHQGLVGTIGCLSMAAAGLVFLVLLVALIVLGTGQMGAFEITEDSIVLKNVSPEFTRAYREMTRDDFAPDVEDVARRQWDRRAEDYNELPRRRRSPELPDPPPDDKYRRG